MSTQIPGSTRKSAQASTTSRDNLGNRDARDKKVDLDSNPSTSIKPKHPSNERGDPHIEEVVVGEDLALITAKTPHTATELHSASRGDRIAQGETSSGSFFRGSSNVEIRDSNFSKVHGDATIIQFADGQFTNVQRNLISDYITKLAVFPDINNNLKKHILTQSMITLPRVEAMFNDYQTEKESGPCFEGTRVGLLREMADWTTGQDESRMYVLSGLAGIGKSTVAYTIASRAADLNLLGASFFFSRDNIDRKNAKKFFTTIAYQLCVYDETFANAIGDVLKTERGSAATTKDPQVQLQALILDPLRNIVQPRTKPILMVVDALDECDEDDALFVLTGLRQLIHDLPSFKVILTTRPQPHIQSFLDSQGGHKYFHLQDIEDKVVDSDIRLYLEHHLSQKQVQKPYINQQWRASDEEIDSLVHVAGRLFVVASTAVRYIFTASNPAGQMQKLLHAFAQGLTPFQDLDHFYAVILQNAVPANCDDDDIVGRYQSVVGTIVSLHRPLPILALAGLINMDVDDIHAVLDNLQSVILLGNDDVPRIYHKSFPDYLTDRTRCQDHRLQIDLRIRHTQIAIHSFKVMDKNLKYNILSLGDPARFMTNENGFKEDGITDEKLQERIPLQLRYACEYWANHFGVAIIEDTDLMNGLAKFADERMLYWFEVLSLIGKMGTAHHAIRLVLKLTASDLHQLLSDALRFISLFYKLIEQSALHVYYSALPFTPKTSLLYHQYIKEVPRSICDIEGGQERWDALIANLNHGDVNAVKFSLDSALFVSWSKDRLEIWDAATGSPISTIPGHRFAVANDFSILASSKDKTVTFYNRNGSTRGPMFTTSSRIKFLALSSETSRVATALSNGTVCLWNSGNGKLIDKFDGSKGGTNQLEFSPTGTRLAYSWDNGIRLRDGACGRSIADLRCGPTQKFEFSGDGSRIASMSRDDNLTLWDSERGGHIAAMHIAVNKSVGQQHSGLAISENGSLLATADLIYVKLWSESRDRLTQVKALQLDMPHDMVFPLANVLAISTSTGVKLYNIKTHSFISSLLTDGFPSALAFAPDYTRLAFGTNDGRIYLWDLQNNDAFSSPSDKDATAVALSQDCSRLACGFVNGKVELWMTNPTKQQIIPSAPRWIMDTVLFRSYRHPHQLTALGFSPDGRLFASGSFDGTIKLWNSGDGSLCRTTKVPDSLRAVAISNNLLVVGCDYSVTLLNLDTLGLIHTSKELGGIVSIAENGALIAVARDRGVSLLGAENFSTINTFEAPCEIRTMAFLSDNSQLVAQSEEGSFLSLDIINKSIIQGPTLEYLIQHPTIPLWRGVPLLHCQDQKWSPQNEVQHYFSTLFSQHKDPVPVLWIPREIGVWQWAQGSSMIALGGRGGRIILLRLPTNCHDTD